MRIWLINPPERVHTNRGLARLSKNLFYNSPPLGLAYLAAYAENAGHQVRITDCPVEGISADDIGAIAREIRPDLAGITSTTTYFHQALKAAKALKQTSPETPLCIGGPHFNANPDLLLAHNEFDFGVRGEGENSLVETAAALESGKDIGVIPGIIKAKGGKLKSARARQQIKDMDTLPYPARHLMPLHKYRPMPNDQHRLPKTSAITSRGCPFQCSFCDKATFGKGYRYHSAQRVVDEIKMLEKDFGTNDIAFVDSLFAPNKKRLTGILDAMDGSRLNASWSCSCRANVLDQELIKRMKANNCWRIRIAIESGNQAILDNICKGISIEDFKKTVRTADDAGLQVKVFFMVGHIGETPSSIEDSINLARSVPIKDITVQINTPLKGTPQYGDAFTKGRVMTEDLSRYNFFQPVFIPEGFSAEQLTKSLKRFYRRFYLSPRTLWLHIKYIRRPGDILKYFRALPLVLNMMFGKQSAV